MITDAVIPAAAEAVCITIVLDEERMDLLCEESLGVDMGAGEGSGKVSSRKAAQEPVEQLGGQITEMTYGTPQAPNYLRTGFLRASSMA